MSNINLSHIPTFRRVEPEDFTVTPFTVNKLWQINQTTASSSYGIIARESRYPVATNFKNNIIPYGDPSKYTPSLDNILDRGMLWYSLNFNYYSPEAREWLIDKNLKLNLYQTASVLSIPTNIIDERIKPSTLTGTLNGISVYDDGNGNLIDTSYNSGSYVSEDYLMGYWGFNDGYKNTGVVEDLAKSNDGVNNGAIFNPGINTTTIVSSSGLMASFNGASNIKIDHSDKISFRQDNDFAISFWVDLPISQSVTGSDTNSIITKRKQGSTLVFDNISKKMVKQNTSINVSGWAYDVSVFNQNTSDGGKLKFSRKGGTVNMIVTSSQHLTGSQYHIVFQKTGSNIQLYVDGTLDSTTSDTVNGNTYNQSDLYLGSLGTDGEYLSGSLDEFRIYNKGLTSTEISGLANNNYTSGLAYQTSRIGNVFYTSGQVIVTDPRPKYKFIFNDTYSLNFKNIHKIYEYEVLCKLKESDFNMTLNPTARVGNNEDSQEPKSFVTGSWTPYITTIGLYNERYQLLAVAKLARPMQKRNDVPMNFIVRFDV